MKRAIALGAWVLIILAGFLCSSNPVLASDYSSPAPEDAAAYLITPQDGDTVTSPFKVQFGLEKMGVAPAGVEKSGTGHHHLLIDLANLPDLSKSLPATEHIQHFGGGQTETLLTLPPGKHTLQLLLANYVHVPHEPPVMSAPITITVE